MVWGNLATRKPDQYYHRLYWTARVIGVLFIILLVRLLWLQGWEGRHSFQQAQSNSMRLQPRRATRGLILDRHLQVLVGNSPSFSVGLVPALLPRDVDDAGAVVDRVAAILKLDGDEIRAKIERQIARPFTPVRLSIDTDRGLVARLEELRDKLPGVIMMGESKRSYPLKSSSHLLGYVGEITEPQLESMADRGYRLGDVIGQTGVERYYDQVLKGEDGGQQVQVNASGQEIKLLYDLAPVPGNNLVLTLDLKVQQAAEAALGDQAGAVVALDPRNGEVLALVSGPNYDLGLFSRRLAGREWRGLMENPSHPLSNRSIQGLYPPGSVFKLVTAAAALDTGSITPETVFTCPGIFFISAFWPYRCWKEVGHGAVDLHRAIVESCDIYFYHVGLETKVDLINRYATELGLGSPSGIDLPNEAAGLVPSPEWKERTQHIPWFPGNTVMMAIGQGYLLATPLQLAVMTAALANGGSLYQPHLMKSVTDPAGKSLSQFAPQLKRQVNIKPETFRFVQGAMEDVVNARGGTGGRARVAGITVAGKTGTAQNPHGPDHADFVCFAPAENPQIAIAVVVENGGEGGLAAAPIARKVMEAYFSNK